MAKPVQLESFSFPTKKAALEFVRDKILHHYQLGQVVTDPEHDLLLRELVARHPDRTDKEGGGVKEFFIGRTEAGDFHPVRHDARGIWIRRTDGTENFSYQQPINQPSKWSDVSSALRTSINNHRIHLREELVHQGERCARSGRKITDWNQAEVRYLDPRWQQLVDGFIHSRGGTVDEHDGHGKIAIGGRLDPADERAWHAYWEANAHPKLVLKAGT